MSDKLEITREVKAVNKSYNEYVVNDRWKKYRSAEYLDYRKRWAENPIKMVVEDFPIHMDIEITNLCNLKCPMCPRTLKLKEKSLGKIESMDFDLFKKLIDESAENGLSSVKFNYMGEPLMHPDVVEMVRYCKDKGIVDVMFNTNAVLLSEEMSRNLLEAGIDGLFISFDSADKAKYESIRVGASYEEVIGNIKKFFEIRNGNEKYWKTQIRVSKVLFPEEGDEDIKAFIDLWKDTVDAIGFSSLMEDSEEDIPYSPDYRCDQPWQRLFIRENGVAFPCCRDNKLEYVVGDINENTIKDIWNNDRYRKLREAHASGRYNEIAMCRKCRYICASSVSIKN